MTQSENLSPQHRPHMPDPDRPKRIANLAAMATNVLRPKDNNAQHTVRYIAQVDKDGWMVKRSKVGSKMDMFVVLEGTTLTVLKNRSAPPRYVVNVRTTKCEIDIIRRVLWFHLPGNGHGKKRLLRLHIPTEDESYAWKHALESAVNSDITDYYSFGKSLGSGAYGDVVEGVDVRTSEKRAIKIIKRGSNMKSREHLECEIQVMKSISHPNIVQTYQIFDLQRTIYIVMEYVPGGDLFDFVAQHDDLTEAQASQCIRSIFRAVSYLHRRAIVHRDLKPENILCANDSWPLQIKVSDFGFASFMDPARGTDNTMRTQVGTAYFMAPEIISNQGHGPAVDSWACGVMLYTILTGRLPFPGRNTTEYFKNVINGQPLFPAILWKGISADAMSLVKGLLNRDPNKRLTSLGALQHRWVDSPDSFANEIRRDRSNLHSRRRKLFKARKAVIAVAMANKFRATIPEMVDRVGDSTKKVAGGIGEGVKKTAVNVKKVGDGIGEGTKKVAEEIGEGTKKVAGGIAEGTKKVAGGIGTGVKKTVGGVEMGAKKVGEGVKKTADGIETGIKKTADGIETGFKKTAGGIETGFKKTTGGIELGLKKTGEGFKKTGEGIKKTGGGIKRGVEKVIDRDRSRGTGTHTERSNTAAGSDSARGPARRRVLFMRRGNVDSISSAVSGSVASAVEPSRQNDVPAPIPPRPAIVQEMKELDGKHSSSEYYSANEEQSDTEEGWERVRVHGEGLNIGSVSAVTSKGQSGHWTTAPPVGFDTSKHQHVELAEFPDVQRGEKLVSKSISSFMKQDSNASNLSASSSRPKLPLLDGLTMGLSEECMAGSSNRDILFDPNDSSGGGEADSLRKTAALLLAAKLS